MQTRYLIGLLFALLLVAMSCSEVTEQPSDCTPNEFYDEELSFCRTCPSVELTACPQDCGFVLEDDDRGCPEATCSCGEPSEGATALPGFTCSEGSFFDEDLATCVVCPQIEPASCQTCPMVGTTRDENGCSQPVCTCTGGECPPVAAPDCGDPGCCDVVGLQDDAGCPFQECRCPETPPEGFFIDEADACRNCEGLDPVPQACMPE